MLEHVTVREAAIRLGKSERTIARWMRTGKLHRIDSGGVALVEIPGATEMTGVSDARPTGLVSEQTLVSVTAGHRISLERAENRADDGVHRVRRAVLTASVLAACWVISGVWGGVMYHEARVRHMTGMTDMAETHARQIGTVQGQLKASRSENVALVGRVDAVSSLLSDLRVELTRSYAETATSVLVADRWEERAGGFRLERDRLRGAMVVKTGFDWLTGLVAAGRKAQPVADLKPPTDRLAAGE